MIFNFIWKGNQENRIKMSSEGCFPYQILRFIRGKATARRRNANGTYTHEKMLYHNSSQGGKNRNKTASTLKKM